MKSLHDTDRHDLPYREDEGLAGRFIVAGFVVGVVFRGASLVAESLQSMTSLLPRSLELVSYLFLAGTIVAYAVLVRANFWSRVALISASVILIFSKVFGLTLHIPFLVDHPVIGFTSPFGELVRESAEPVAWILLLLGIISTSVASYRTRNTLVHKNALLVERLDMQNALKDSQAKFSSLIGNIPDFAFLLTPDGIVKAVNRIIDGTPEDVLGKPIHELMHSDERERVDGILKSVRDSRTPVQAEIRGRGPGGEWAWYFCQVGVIESGDAIDSIVVIARNVTEEKKAREALIHVVEGTSSSTGKDFYKSLVQHLAEALDVRYVLIGEYPEGEEDRIQILTLWGNDALQDTLTYDLMNTPCENVVGRTLCHYPEGVQQLFPKDRLLVAMGVDSYLGIPLISSEGTALGILVAMDDKPMPTIRSAATIMNIFGARVSAEMERERAEKARLDMESQMQHSQKLESLGVLAGGIAHDFNNLLVAMLGNASLVKEDLTPDDYMWEPIDEIETAARRAADLTQQMLAYSGKGRFLIKPMNLSKVVREMSNLISASLSKKAVLEMDLQEDIIDIGGDLTQVRQIVMNLITNASDALNNDAGSIVLRTYIIDSAETPGKDTLVTSDACEGPYAVIEVSDTGQGMDEYTRSKMLDPFFTTKFTGRGLGLAAVSGIVRGHKGSMTVESAVGSGTTVRVLFPASSADLRKMVVEPDSTPPTNGNAQGYEATVLLVDDEESNRSVLRRALERSKFHVMEAGDGGEAVSVFRKHHQEITVVLLDLTMPVMDGPETLRELVRIDPSVHVVLSSGYAEEEARARFDGAELHGFIQKPYTSSELLHVVGNVSRLKNSEVTSDQKV